MEPLLTIRPPRGCWFFMTLIASCVQRKAPVRLTSTTDFHCSNVRSSSGTGGAPDPALLKRRSNRSNASTVWAKRALTDPGSPTSVGTLTIRTPSLDPSKAVDSKVSFWRHATTTQYAWPERDRAAALPIPRRHQLTLATLDTYPLFSPTW